MIRFDHVSKQYSGTTRPALNAINLEVLRGEFVFLVGASGSGKSSCLRLILKEEKATKGKIHVLGQDVGAISSRKVPYFRRNIGVVFQDFRLLPNKSVFDNVAFTLQVIGKSRGFIQEAVPDVLKMVGLSGKASRLPHELSGGEQQRVAIARAVVNKPQVLLADEPTGNLDPATSAGIMAVLERINAGGTTVLMATHEAGIVDQMQRRVVELVSGQIVRDERHGGYGFTSAIPTTHVAMADASGDAVTRNTAPVRIPTHAVPDLHAAELSAEAAAAAPPVLVPPRSAPAPVAPEQVAPDNVAPAGAAPAPTEPTTETARLSAHFAAPPTQPVIRNQPLPDEELPEQLSLAERLGLRAPGDDQDITGEQNVGPTK
ncbi:MAG TPA: cell division ATP-binding protein FtsE [Microbacteriaceae bacterium]|nr:cell division ATP-binding protein FtsE [Microbacteriaceae bacterium]